MKEKFSEDLHSKNFLKFYSKYFNNVETNNGFYYFTKKSTFEKWVTQINTDFEQINTDKDNPHKSVSNPHKSVNFLFYIKLHLIFTHFQKLKLNKDDKRILKETIESYKVLEKKIWKRF